MTCKEVDELLAGLALGGASPEEERLVQEHLSSCHVHNQVADYRRIAGMLPMSLLPRDVPDLTKRRLMARVYKDLEPQLLRPPVWRRAWMGLAAAALALLALGLGVRDYLVTAQLAAAPVQWKLGSAGDAATTGTLVYLPAQKTATLMLDRLPTLQASQVFEVWLIKDSQPVAAGVFRPGPDGAASVLLKGDVGSYDVVAVTSEPGPTGSTTPTSQPFVAGSLR